MPEPLRYTPPGAARQPLRLAAPGSKSLTQRALLLAALASGESRLRGALDCADSRALCGALRALGVAICEQEAGWLVQGGALRPAATALCCDEAGTALRFLAPLSLLLPGPLLLDGRGRLGRRPLAPLLDALAQLGVRSRSLRPQGGTLPLELQRQTTSCPKTVSIAADQSSQFVSGLLQIAPLLPGGLELVLAGEPVSRPYLGLTVAMMRSFGATVEVTDTRYRVPPGSYHPQEAQLEGDWSGAAFLLAAAWILRRPLELENLNLGSLQGDRAMLGFLEALTREEQQPFDLCHCPDLIAPLAAVCACADRSTALLNVSHARLKESDRLAVLARGLTQAGVGVQAREDGLIIHPAPLRPCRLDPAGDHRMAMAFGLLQLRQPGIEVNDPACVAKSFPDFWDQLTLLREAR